MYYDYEDDDLYRQPIAAPFAPALPIPPPVYAPYCEWKKYWKRYWLFYNWWRNNSYY